MTTNDGYQIPADVVIVGVGVQPNTELAEQATLPVDNGVLVDAALRTDSPDVYAAGDVANAVNPVSGADPCRALGQRAAQRTRRGPLRARPAGQLRPGAVLLHRPVRRRHGVHRWFAPGGYDALVTRGDLQARTFYAFWLAVAGMHVNKWDAGIAPVQDLIRSGAPVDRQCLADPGVPLTELLSRHGAISGLQGAR